MRVRPAGSHEFFVRLGARNPGLFLSRVRTSLLSPLIRRTRASFFPPENALAHNARRWRKSSHPGEKASHTIDNRHSQRGESRGPLAIINARRRNGVWHACCLIFSRRCAYPLSRRLSGCFLLCGKGELAAPRGVQRVL